MEKYKRFTDAQTSVNPFVPRSTAPSLGRVIAMAIPGTLRCFVFLVAMVLLEVAILLDDVFQAVRLTAITRPLLYTPFVSLFARIALVALGVSAKVEPFPARPSTATVGSDSNWPPKAGDCLVCNAQSPLDILVLLAAAPSRPLTFAWPVLGGEGEARLLSLHSTPFRAMMGVLKAADPRSDMTSSASSSSHVRGYDLSNRQRLCASKGRVLVFFPEGTTSNGRGLLKTVLYRTNDDTAFSTILTALTYSTPIHNAVLPSGLVSFVTNAAMNAGFSMTRADVTPVRPSHGCANLDPFAPTNSASGGFSSARVEAQRSKLAQAASQVRLVSAPCHPLTLDAGAKGDFLKQWDEYNR